MLAAAAQADRKVHGSSALLALAHSSSEEDVGDAHTETQVGSGSSAGAQSHAHTYSQGRPLSQTVALPPSTPPLEIAGQPLAEPQQRTRSPSGSSGSRLSFLSCFGSFSASFGSLGTLGASSLRQGVEGEDLVAACEVGIRPSFYWVEAPGSVEERQEAEASFRFLKADCQDDARVIHNFAGIPGLTFAGVFDGHGPYGRAAAKFAAEHVPRLLAEQTAALHSRSERKRLKAMREACRQAAAAMRDHSEAGFDASMSGTTACIALISGTHVLLANVGDSRCVVARQRPDGRLEAVPLTVDAKPELPDETRRIEMAGGVVRQLAGDDGGRRGAYRVFRRGDDVLPGLAMSRSLGDLYAHSVGVTWEPSLSSHALTQRDLFLVLATDGLWDVMTNAGVADFVQRYRHSRDPGVSCAEALTLEAQERWKAAHDEALVDDISVAILHTSPLPPPRPRRNDSHPAIPRLLARAASTNDEANLLFTSWQASADNNPSHHSPRQFFRHLYNTQQQAGEGSKGSSEGGSQRSEGDKRLRAAAGHVAAAALNSGSTPAGSPWLDTPLLSPTLGTAAASGGEAGHPSASSEASPEGPPPVGPPPTHFRPFASRLIQIPGRQAPSPAPASAVSAPMRAHSMPVPQSSLEDSLLPVRKAYPSTADLQPVPSWDSATFQFHSLSVKPEACVASTFGSGHGLAPEGSDTPRSIESNGSGAEVRARRGEGRHEGKVHRGIPASFSSAGLASCGGHHSETGSPLGGASRTGSLEERGGLAAAAHSDAGNGSPVRRAVRSSPQRQPPASPGRPLGRSSSDSAARLSGLPLSRSSGFLSGMSALRGGSGYGGGIVVVRQVHSPPSPLPVPPPPQ